MLTELLNRLHEEEKSGYVNKETLLQIVEYYASRSLREFNKEPNMHQFGELLDKYHIYRLIVTSRYTVPFYVDRERKKPYQKRCANCGLAVTNKILSNHTCRTAKKSS